MLTEIAEKKSKSRNRKTQPVAKILLWDIESSNLNADFGYMICFGYKWLGENKVHVISIDDFDLHKKDPTNDREVCRAALDVLKSSDMWVTWFGCPTADQRILTSDLRFVKCGELKVGDELLAFDEEIPSKQARRRYKKSYVTNIHRFYDEAYLVKFEDGSSIEVTGNHPILVFNKENLQWREASKLKPGQYAYKMIDAFNSSSDYEAGWLSGFFDGEGSLGQYQSLNRYTPNSYTFSVAATQKVGPTLDKCMQYLDKYNFDYGISKYDPGQDDIRAVRIRGGNMEYIRFLGLIRPERLLNKFSIEKLNTVKFGKKSKVISVESTGRKEIIGISTSSKTYILEGYASHNSRFDVPFVRARLLSHRAKIKDHVLPDRPHVDGWWVCRHKLKIHSNRLASASSFLGVSEKTPIKPEHWIKAMSGNAKSIKYIKDHCRQDVIVLEDVYKELMPYHTTHPNVALMDGRPGCPNCGKDKLIKQGVYVARTNVFQRYQCTSCLSWSRFGKAHKVTGK